jgi:hypothetical protein
MVRFLKRLFSHEYFIHNDKVTKEEFEVYTYLGKLPERLKDTTNITKDLHTKRNSVKAAIDLYKSMSLEEARAIHPALVTFWRIGRRTSKSGIMGYGTIYPKTDRQESINLCKESRDEK